MAKDFILPPPPNPRGQAELIVKNLGLTFLKPKFFNVDTDKIDIEQESLNDTNTFSFGLPVFDSVLFQGMTYISNEGNEITVDSFSMNVVLCEVYQTRNIVITSISGRNGTVKEYIGDDDYTVTIKGMLVTQYQNVPPDLQKQALLKFCTAPVSFKVVSNYINSFNINNIVIGNYNFKQIEGTRNSIMFELNCYSDIPIEVSGSGQVSVSSLI